MNIPNEIEDIEKIEKEELITATVTYIKHWKNYDEPIFHKCFYGENNKGLYLIKSEEVSHDY
jgi:hypothetical protein